MRLEFDKYESPIGTILLVTNEGKLVSLDFAGYEARFEQLLTQRFGTTSCDRKEGLYGIPARVRRYFEDRDFAAFDDVDVETRGTPFQQEVWTTLRKIPAGRTWTYGELARYIGKPKGFRAVGHANSLNPIGIILPCHRVIGSDASLTGYAGGLHRKKWLLEHEGALSPSLL
jgi:methylated-DNA-[protein]-cysteine S-methyltransferase